MNSAAPSQRRLGKVGMRFTPALSRRGGSYKRKPPKRVILFQFYEGYINLIMISSNKFEMGNSCREQKMMHPDAERRPLAVAVNTAHEPKKGR
jgi:hypothetical protein